MDKLPTQPSIGFANHLPIVRQGLWSGRHYLPLEHWRLPQGWDLYRSEPEARCFRSSGTSGAARSHARFSSSGLAAYKAQSLAHFLEVLGQVLPLPHGVSPLPPAHGLSLVPTVQGWPDSSLAQMVAWIGEVLPLSYCSDEDLGEAITRHDTQPIWLFGTAFHFLNAMDGGYARRLPAGSIIVETGGTKGKSREVSRAELYHDLAAAFGVSEAAIISEYGMCELACQAYDFVPRGATQALNDRRFRFQAKVNVAVLTAPGCTMAQGRGALVVDDSLRLDAPWPLRTEDLVELDGTSFKLLGRAPSQPLKGCSLQVDELIRAPVINLNMPVLRAEIAPTPGSIMPRVAFLAQMITDFATGPDALGLLHQELGSEAAATAALQDLSEGLPSSAAAWVHAALTAAGTQPLARDWLFILPANHSIVGLYPLALAYLLGLQVTVRLPRRFAAGGNVLTAFIARIQALPEAMVAAVAPSLRLSSREGAASFGAVLAYGSDETIALLHQQAQTPVRGFGGRVGVSLVDNVDLGGQGLQLARDLLSLGQNGCMATRLVVVVGEQEHTATSLASHLAASCERFWAAPLPWQELVGLDFEAVRLAATGALVLPPEYPGRPLVAIYEVPPGTKPSGELIEAMIARAPFTVTVLWLAESADILGILSHLRQRRCLGQVTTTTSLGREFAMQAPDLAAQHMRPLGTANRQTWCGFHEAEPLFASLTLKKT